MWKELGNDFGKGLISVERFYNLLLQHLPSLRHIRLETLSVVDHLGRNIPIPTNFCASWEVRFVYSVITPSRVKHLCNRTLTTSSLATAEIGLGMILSREAIIKLSALKPTKVLGPWNLLRW